MWLGIFKHSDLFQTSHSYVTLHFVSDINSGVLTVECPPWLGNADEETRGQSYKASANVDYDSSVINICNLLVNTTLES